MLGDTLRGKDILVTGGAGFIGSHLVDRLIEVGAKVTFTAKRPPDSHSLEDALAGSDGPPAGTDHTHRSATVLQQDITVYSQLQELVQGRDFIFHLAANATTKESSMGWKDPFLDYEVNALGTLNLLEAIAHLRNRPRVVYTSTASVYGIPERLPVDESHPTKPVSPHGVSKLAAESYCHAYTHERRMDVVVVRIFSVYGPRQRRYVIYDLLTKLQRDPHQLEVLGTGRQERDYCYVSDAVDALIIAAERGKAGDVCNLARGTPIEMRELVDRLLSVAGLKGITRISFTGHTWDGDIPRIWGTATKLRSLGFAPKIDLEEGLGHFYAWIRRATAVGRG